MKLILRNKQQVCGRSKIRFIISAGLTLGLTSLSHAALVANIDGPAASVSAFQAADAQLLSTSVSVGIINQGGFFAAQNIASASIPTATGSTTIIASTTGGPNNNGFAPAGASWTNGDPILGSNLFNSNGGNIGVDFTNLSTLDTGSTITVTIWGIGDNIGQDSTISATFGGSTLSGDTAFNDGVSPQGDSTGAVPFQQFSFTADGVTDLIDVEVVPGPGGEGRSHFSGFSISVTPVPEPSSALLVGLGGLALISRRRRG